jgi:serine/threonine protein kinase
LYPNHKADVFSFGVVLWELLTARIPHYGTPVTKLIVQVATEELRLPVPEITSIGLRVPLDIAQLIRECFNSDPTERPDFEDITPRLEEAISEAPEKIAPPTPESAGPAKPSAAQGSGAPLLADGGPTLLYAK